MNSFFSNRRFLINIFFLLLAAFPVLVKSQQKNRKAKLELSPQSGEKSPFKKYNQVITADAETQKGLFKVHKVGENYYFEIPKSILRREILVVSRISSTPNKYSAWGAGVYTKLTDHQVIRFQKEGNDILLKLIQYSDVADKELPIYQSVKSNNFEPIVYSFKIETVGTDLSSYVINVSDFFTTDVPLIGVKNSDLGLSGVDKSRSFISEVIAYPKNVEVRHILTYRASKLPYKDRNNSLSFEMNQSIVLLTEHPMIPRLHDSRLGFLTTRHVDYSVDAHRATTRQYILRWRLEPSDWELYKKGKLVKPVKPIIFYIDSSTPSEWRNYIKKGVEDWQQAFEKIGFENAIMAKDSPSPQENPDWNINDFNNSVIRYVATEKAAAAGFTVHDPRTGEILKADIQYGHNHLDYIRKLFFIQTAGANPEARSIQFDDKVMGNLIRTVIAHEVGHTLGLAHSFAASRAYPVDSLRSPSFTTKHGNSASIMDYAWGNYIAQPEDSIKNFYSQIGEYDHWAIKYGYQPIPDINSPKQEESLLNHWIKKEVNNPLVRFPTGIEGFSDLGDDPLKASEYGIKNLKLIIQNLIRWTTEEGKDYTGLTALYKEAFEQFERYIEPVQLMVGGVLHLHKTSDEKGSVHRHLTLDKQKQAVAFLNEHLFKTPFWLMDKDILAKVPGGLYGINTQNLLKKIQKEVLSDIMLIQVRSMILNESLNGENAYTPSEFFSDLIIGIYSEIYTGNPIDVYKRNLQKLMVDQLGNLINIEEEYLKHSDVPSIALASLVALREEIERGLLRLKDKMSRYHLQDLLMRIDKTLAKE